MAEYLEDLEEVCSQNVMELNQFEPEYMCCSSLKKRERKERERERDRERQRERESERERERERA